MKTTLTHKDLERPWDYLPRREFLPESGEPIERIRCTRLADETARVEMETATLRIPMEQKIVWHSPSGFEWSYAGSGPADFALNILALVIDPLEAGRLHQRFKGDMIASMDRDGGVIPMSHVRAWVQAVWAEEQADAELMDREERTRELSAQIAEDERREAERRKLRGEEEG